MHSFKVALYEGRSSSECDEAADAKPKQTRRPVLPDDIFLNVEVSPYFLA
jgi:hypothetical protein